MGIILSICNYVREQQRQKEGQTKGKCKLKELVPRTAESGKKMQAPRLAIMGWEVLMIKILNWKHLNLITKFI
jgi:hypothetical protein